MNQKERHGENKMGRYKDYNYDQMRMIPVAFDRQIFPGSFVGCGSAAP
ncbi:MAG: hypothetical protein KZQ95_15710 [Candidatus Thiodiazotropha sp. (ex Epidulcina cf. delphinae)]|nr:hypothetical protein [Candidatus Thiodiazotropha sp. (ex Epidulcina cf. delphinae)]MCU7926166.1 hypothetical protein [Candidatus Thiodiazotropha sp. (ex Dulcina madagascariensis)]